MNGFELIPREIYDHIIEFVPKGSYKKFIYSCKAFYSLHTEEQIKIREKKEHVWDWDRISHNPSISTIVEFTQ